MHVDAPTGYKKLPKGARCKCVRGWTDGSDYWCCIDTLNGAATDAEITLEPEGLEAARLAVGTVEGAALFNQIQSAIRAYLSRSTLPREGQGEVGWPEGFFVMEPRTRLYECATEGCEQRTSIRIERGGVGSNYCEPCALKIAATLAPALSPSPAVRDGVVDWQDIITAPRDGTPVLGFMPSYYQGRGGQSVILWVNEMWMDSRAWETFPTHWQPLPAPPASALSTQEQGNG